MSHPFPRSHRLSGDIAFAKVFDARMREQRGPVLLYGIPNNLKHPRLGLSVSRKVGIAVKRNRLKRLMREAFRMLQHDLPCGYDWMIVLRPHEELPLADYQRILSALMVKLHGAWQKRQPAEEK